MTEINPSFSDQIAATKEAEKAPDTTSTLEYGPNNLSIRHRGCFITECALTEPTLGNSVSILHSDQDLETPKLTASHVMSPVGLSEGIGGQHGFPRWADYREFPQDDGPSGEKRTSFQAKRSDLGLGLVKTFELTGGSLSSSTTLLNSESEAIASSLGEHYYFRLEDEDSSGLMVNDKTLDELLGEGAEEKIMAGTPIFWPSFEGEVTVSFPAGHSVKLSATTEGAGESELGMLFWHRPGSESICFEPTLGFSEGRQNNGLSIGPYQSITLNTKIELLAKDSPTMSTLKEASSGAEVKERELKVMESGKVQTGEYTITDWLQALNPARLTPSAWLQAIQGGRSDRSESRISFINSQGVRVLEITRMLTRYSRTPTDGGTGSTEIKGRDFTNFIADPLKGQVYLQNDYTLINSGSSPDVFRLQSQDDGKLAEETSVFIEGAAALAAQPGSRIEVRDALGEIHVIPASEHGWDFDEAQYDVRRTNRQRFPESGVAAIGRLATSLIPEITPASA